MARCGSPGVPLAATTAIELVGGIGGLYWHAALERDADAGTSGHEPAALADSAPSRAY